MIIESIEIYKQNGQSDLYEVGSRMTYKMNDKEQQSYLIQNIALEPTGQVALTLASDKVILIGNTPYRIYARPLTEEEIAARNAQEKKMQEAQKAAAAKAPPAPPEGIGASN